MTWIIVFAAGMLGSMWPNPGPVDGDNPWPIGWCPQCAVLIPGIVAILLAYILGPVIVGGGIVAQIVVGYVGGRYVTPMVNTLVGRMRG